jgi:hypothetical protein
MAKLMDEKWITLITRLYVAVNGWPGWDQTLSNCQVVLPY